jgi:glycosyltransferase involved in cell wall biosynthesis
MIVKNTVHIIGSKDAAGAERFGLRLMKSFHERDLTVTAMLRRGSAVIPRVHPGIPVVEIPMKTVWDPISKFAIKKELERIKPQVVQTYMGRATRLTRIDHLPGVLHIARLGGYYKLAGYRHADAWIGITRGLCDYMVRGGLPAKHVFQISNFVDPPVFISPSECEALRQKWKIPIDALVVLTMGRLVPVKGHIHLLEAFAKLGDQVDGRPLHLVFVGDGPLMDPLRSQARHLGLEGRVCWAGWQTQPGGYYQIADVVVFPSLEREGLGNVILEAWAYNKPLLTTESRGAREITHHGQDALRVPCGDSVALAEALGEILKDQTLRNDLAARGYERVNTEFNPETIIEQYLNLYSSLLDRPARHG